MAGHFSYLAMLAFTFLGSSWLIIFYKMKLGQDLKKIILAILPISLLFLIWDIFAIKNRNWFFNKKLISNIYLPFHIPLEEFLFFLVVPFAAILTLEAVLAARKNWKIN